MSATIGHFVAREIATKRRDERSPARRARRRLPLPPLIALGGFALVGLLALLPARKDDQARPIALRNVEALASADGSLRVQNLADGKTLGFFPGDKDSFVRGVFHSLSTYRQLQRVVATAPYRISALTDGRVLLSDPSTSTTIDLEGFGSSNASTFTALLGLPPVKAPE